jgi:4'-phosphopantetheinyl transferase
MPLFKTIKHKEQTHILVWHITETLDELKQGISLVENSVQRLENSHSEQHQKGFVSIRQLLKIMGYADADLFYTADGKPHLKDGKRISITHSFDFAAIIISDFAVGIDIEMNREKILKIAPKFMSEEWAFYDAARGVEFLTVIWGAKESLYKIHPDGGLLFKEHLPIEPFQLQDGKTKGWIKKDKYYEFFYIYFESFEGYTLVFAVN